MAKWTEHCGPGAEGESLDALPTVALGSPYELVNSGDPDDRQSMTIKGIECSLSKLDGGASNPEWAGSKEIPETISVKAGPGMEFCRITASFEVTGKRPVGGWTDFGNLVAEDGTEYAEDEMAAEATQMINYKGMPSECSPYLCGTHNPGSPAFDVVKIYRVPAGTEPTAVQYPMANVESGPEVLMALK